MASHSKTYERCSKPDLPDCLEFENKCGGVMAGFVVVCCTCYTVICFWEIVAWCRRREVAGVVQSAAARTAHGPARAMWHMQAAGDPHREGIVNRGVHGSIGSVQLL